MRTAVAAVLAGVVGMAVLGAPQASAQGCEPSPLPCSQILVDLPYSLDFGSDHGGVDDRDGVGTGFTYVDPPTNGTGYIPENLFADTAAGKLRLTTTAGTSLRTADSLDNALAVGIDAPSQVTRIETTLNDPPPGTGGNEQAGLWFGNDEDNYVKFVVISRIVGGDLVNQIEFRIEENGISHLSNTFRTDPLDLAGKDVTLSLVADPGTTTIDASYSIDGGTPVAVGSFPAPPRFFSFDAARIDPEIGTDSFGGILASHVDGPDPLTYAFDGFSVVKERDVVPPAPTVLPGGIAFEKAISFVPFPTSIAVGPDGRVYVSELFGTIHALTLDEEKTAVSDEVITTLGERLTLGLEVDPLSTPENVILWASHSSPSVNGGTPNSGVVSRLSGPGFATKEDVITGLPRAIANHATNSIDFGPDDKLYIAQGGNTGSGAPSENTEEFGQLEEQPLSAALLVADVRSPTFDGSCANPTDILGPPPCDVTTFATGLRNMYDFAFHSNGEIYGPDNGSGVNATFPASPSAPCDVASVGLSENRPWDDDPPGHNPGAQQDSLYRLQQGAYHGHPNPQRDECVLKDGSFQGVAPLPNYEPPIVSLGRNRSANGTIEYTSDAHCGSLKGDLLLTSYSIGDDLTRVELSEDGESVLSTSSVFSGLNEPLPLAQDPDGTVYVGEFASGTLTALKPVDAGCWTEREDLPVELLDAGGAALGGKLYTVAGEDDNGHLSTMRIYDPGTGSWSTGPDLPGPGVENPAAVAEGGKLYVFGGSASGSFSAVNNAAVFDPVANSWTALPAMPTARSGAMAQAVGGKLYVAGGLGTDGASLASVDVFDPAAGVGGSWSSAAPMGTRRDNAGSAVLDGKLYVFGGGTRNISGGYAQPTLATVEMYDPGTDSWVPRADMPTGRRSMVTGTLDGRAQLIGGERKGTDETFPENEEYDPATDTWRTLTPMRTPRHGAAAGTIGDAIYVAGGGTDAGTSFSAVNESFAFAEPEDDDPPNTTIDTGPADGSTVADDDPAFTYSGDPAADVDHFECKLDSEPDFTTCPDAGISYTDLDDGSHTFSVRAVDAHGNADADPASRTWTIDTAGPNTTIDTGPADGSTVADDDPAFTYSGDPAADVDHFECKLDSEPDFTTCPDTGISYTDLDDGSHTFSVRAVDAHGNADADPASRTWTIDTAAPDGDGDGVPDADDNCPAASNAGQENFDGDADGDACDSDDDGDGVNDADDACAQGELGWTSGPATDHDGDGCRDSSEDPDDDDDNVADASDSCPTGEIGPGTDSDGDGCKDSEELGGGGQTTPPVAVECVLAPGTPAANGCPSAARTLTLRYSERRERFLGKLRAPAFEPCAVGQQVVVRRKKRGPDEKLGGATTRDGGSFVLKAQAERGKYYATLSLTLVDAVACDAARSRTVNP